MTDQSQPKSQPTPAPQPQPTQQPQPAHQAAQPPQQAQPEQTKSSAPNRPADTMRAENVKATIWSRDNEKGPAYATKITRTYKDADGQLNDSPYLSGADLLRAARVAEMAYVREGELKQERALSRDERKAQHQDARTQEQSHPKTPSRDR
jgi:hypothetical protein